MSEGSRATHALENQSPDAWVTWGPSIPSAYEAALVRIGVTQQDELPMKKVYLRWNFTSLMYRLKNKWVRSWLPSLLLP